ncbi:PBCV-specific basic adaptor domain-containing protein [Acanthocystis turfacea Chlorella virus TN603.4.2]|nr:PBCV-specific basic adaptor domain-containing protein [Acanthocystis turfacea Chlorella virus TN603.4.2]
MAMDTGKKDAKGRPILKGPRGGEYVLSTTGKKVAPVVNSDMKLARAITKKALNKVRSEEVIKTGGKLDEENALGRPIFRGPLGGRYVITASGSKVPPAKGRKAAKAAPAPAKLVPATESGQQNAVKRIAMAWKKKVNDRAKPMRKKNYTKNKFLMAAPKLKVHLTEMDGFGDQSYHDFPFDIETARGPRINSGSVVAPRENNFRQIDYLVDQVEYLRGLSMHDLITVMGYTNHSHFWLGPFQREGKVFSRFPDVNKGGSSTVPMWSQFDIIVSSGYDVLKPNAPAAVRDLMNQYDKLSNADRYLAYTFAVNENYVTKDSYSLMLKLYVADLTRIIYAAPTSKQPLIVYRGTDHDIYKGVKGNIFKSTQFMSTAYLPKHAMQYARGKNGILTRVTIPPGKPSLFIAPVNKYGEHGEYEIVLPPGDFEITGRSKKTQVFTDKFITSKVTDLKML